MSEVKSSRDWLNEPEFKDLVIMDPDGWDRKNYRSSMDEMITRDEFVRRMARSTTLQPVRFSL